jgi:ankyrin repeat protein
MQICSGSLMSSRDQQVHQLAHAGRTAALVSLLAWDHKWATAKGEFDRTPLHYAAAAGSADCIKALLYRSQYLHVTLERPQSVPAEKALLLQQRSTFIDPPDSLYAWTPLFYAVQSDSLACVQLLLEAGADPNHPSSCAETPIAYSKSSAIANLLLEYGAKC